MIIKSCKTNHTVNPMGYAMTRPVFTWVTESSVSKRQSAAQIVVASDFEMRNILYDTGKTSGLSNLATEIPIRLAPYMRYFWTVRVFGDSGDEAVSDVNWFETGKLNDIPHAKWITPPWEDTAIHPYIRKRFSLNGKVKSARAYAIGLGVYKLELNNQTVGSEYLAPGCNSYDAWLQYRTYDITNLLAEGDNVIGAMLGNGWAKGRFGTFGDINSPYINKFALLLELRITMEDGSVVNIATDKDFKCKPSPIIRGNIYDGEVYDAEKEILDWSLTSLDDSDWDAVKEFSPEGLGKVQDRLSPPIVIKETLRPVDLLHTPAGETVLDMGQNMVGWLRFKIHEPSGTEIRISFGEVLQEDNFYNDNLRSAKQEYIYISNGKPATIEPSFTFYGFRYAKLEGFTQPINPEDFMGCVVYSDLEECGWIETSDHNVNRLFLNTKWGQKGNFLDVPTDCPQRDERMGWTGDAQVFCKTASFNMDTYSFYIKFMYDVWKDQQFKNGMTGNVVPSFLNKKESESSFYNGGSCGWGDCATIIPWEVYIHFGDITILKQQYDSMKAWVDWIRERDVAAGNTRLWTTDHQWGDWLALDNTEAGSTFGGTDTAFIASAYYKYSSELLSKAAKILDKCEDYIFYSKLSEEIRQAIFNEYFSKNGRSVIHTQTAYVLALHFNLVPDEVRARVLGDLTAIIKKNTMHLTTGFIGTPFLCRVLSDCNESDIAYEIFLQDDYPGWIYEVKMGATTIWERWNSILPNGRISDTGMNSLNHYAYGSIVEWMYRHMCGINSIDEHPGFKRFIIKPQIYHKLRFARAKFKSPMGIIESSWERDDSDHLTISVTVPFDSEAILFLPGALLENIEGIEGISAVQKDGSVKAELLPGSYKFRYRP